VFTNHLGAALDAGNVRKMFKRVCDEAEIGDGWTPRELRTTEPPRTCTSQPPISGYPTSRLHRRWPSIRSGRASRTATIRRGRNEFRSPTICVH